MRISDWSSDVCSSDLGHFAFVGLVHPHVEDRIVITASLAHKSGAMDYGDLDASRSYHPWQRYQMSKLANLLHMIELDRRLGAAGRSPQAKIGRASCRERVCQYV